MAPSTAPDPLAPVSLAGAGVPPPDLAAEPHGFLVTADDGTRIHFLDWGGPPAGNPDPGGQVAPAVVLVPGLLAPAWSWTPVARRLLGCRRTVVVDLRGHGLSDAPPGRYDLGTLGADVAAAAEASGAIGDGGVILAGHGFGAAVATVAALALGGRCAGLVLVDGGWERSETVTGLDVDEFLREVGEPPEVLRSMDAWLEDRRGFDPASWDADQERAARDAVVETAAGRVVRAVRPHVVEAVVRTMFGHDPAGDLARVAVPATALVALATGDPEVRLAELRRAAAARDAAGGQPVGVVAFPSAGHNLPRYRPAEVAAAILAAARATIAGP